MRTRRVLLVLVASIGATTSRQGFAADAPADNVADVVRHLEAASAATRARAAEALGGRYPEAAEAVPVLLDAVHDEDEAVRAAAVRALRRLGQRGQTDAVAAWQSIESSDLKAWETGFAFGLWIGSALAASDYASGTASSAQQGPDRLRMALQGIPTLLPLSRPYLLGNEHTTASVRMSLPWLRSSDPTTARTAASVVTLLGRGAVAHLGRGADPDPTTASSEALLSLLAASHSVQRFAGWRLLAVGPPHGPNVTQAVVAAGAKLGPDPPEPGPSSPPTTLELTRRVGVPALGTLGAAAKGILAPEQGTAPAVVYGNLLRSFIEVEAYDAAVAAWPLVVDEWQASRRAGKAPRRAMGCLEPMGAHPRTAAAAAGSIAMLLELEGRSDPEVAALLAPDDRLSSGARDSPPHGVGREHEPWWAPMRGAIELAWLAHRAPSGSVPEDVLARTATVLGRALVRPDQATDRRFAAERIADLGRPGLVPAATLLDSLFMARTQADPTLEAALLAALAVVGDVPPDDVDPLVVWAMTPAPITFDASLSDRAAYAAEWPHVVPTLAIRQHGSTAFGPHVRRLSAIDALGGVRGAPTSVKDVLLALKSDPDAQVRYRAARALRRLSS